MNRAFGVLSTVVLSCAWLMGGCGGGSTGTIIPPPPPPPANPVPAIATVMPSFVLAGSADTPITITGTGFISSSTAQWNGAALATTYNSATSLSVTLPAADLTGSSASSITVQNPAPGGGTSAGATFEVNSPAAVITTISPRYVPPGNPATITVNGTGFESNSIVMWNTAARPTTFVSATTLQVALSAADLQNQGTGSLTVGNPAPAASTSPAAPLVVTSQPVPVIQSVSIASSTSGPAIIYGGCAQLQVTITGQNFASDSIIQANGVLLPTNVTYGPNPTILINDLPTGFVSAPGALFFTVTNPDLGPIVSNTFAYPATSPAALAVCATPSAPTIYAPSSFSLTVQPSEVNLSGNGTLTLGALPSGITWANTSVSLPPSGATLHLQAANTTVAATYAISLNGTVAGTNAQGTFNFTVSTGAPPSFFLSTSRTEVGVPIGGSGSIQFSSILNQVPNSDFDVTPSVSGLPPGTTATFSPNVFSVGQNVTVTLSAASTAPVTQNATVTLIGTPSAQVSNATANFFADVTQPPGSLPGNRSDFVSTAGAPYAAVYDASHNLIFSSNPSWNRVDVISNSTHKIVKSIPMRSPRGIDITQDNSTVWVQTAGLNLYAINTTSLQANQYSLPKGPVATYGVPVSINTQGDRVFALSDGTLFIYFGDAEGEIGASAGIWNPQNGQMTVLASGIQTGLSNPIRSGDGTMVYAVGSPTVPASGMSVYNVASKTLSAINFPITAATILVAVNRGGSELILDTAFNTAGDLGIALYDHNLNLLGPLPGGLTGYGQLSGGVLFSAYNTKIYEVGVYDLPAILTIDASKLTVLAIAPTANSQGGGGTTSTPTPFAMDAIGVVLGVQNYGISFDDSTFYQNYATNQPTVNGGLGYTQTYAGPLTGGTASSLYTFPNLTPDVWFGQTRGSASLSPGGGPVAQGELTFTSPPSTTPGPVNVKFIYPDGEQAFGAQLFSYSTSPEYALISGSAPSGGVAAQIIGYGLPADSSGGTVTVGGNAATITSTVGQYPPFSPEPFPSAILNYTLPAGTPGWADLQVTTPIGTGTLPKSIFYAKSVTDYSSSDTFQAVLVDENRKQVYLSAGDHIDVFSTVSNQFVSPLTPAAVGSQKQFAGLALTPDGRLLAGDVPDNSLAVINPDNPTSSSGNYAIPMPVNADQGINGCVIGPVYIAAASTLSNLAFVNTGGLDGSCFGLTYIANLATHAVTNFECTGDGALGASADGNFVVIDNGPCIYNVQTSALLQASFPYAEQGFGVEISGDGNVIATGIFGDINGNILGSAAQPIALCGSPTSNRPELLPLPQFNASGSLFYLSYPNYFEIIDVAHAALRMRFALTETTLSCTSSIAIDSGGRFVYLITNQMG